MPHLYRLFATLSIFMILALPSVAAIAQVEYQRVAVNPLRLSYVNGSVSFWRYGAEDWVEARINTPLTTGDALYTGNNGGFELQGEGRAFIRADSNTQITLINQTPDFLQLKVPSGRVSLDLRTLPVLGYTIEVDTPNAVFTIDHTGYYRVDVDGDVHFVTRRGGQAILTLAGGEALTILPSEEIVVRQGSDVAQAETYVAPELNDWDRWNYDRTNDLIDAFSERYVPYGVAGARDLDHYGIWRITDNYGPVWVPDATPIGWAPYSTGRWVWDPYYHWTWVDDAPWGWAPYHYGRWIYLGGYWAWAPGPVVVRRAVYAPALVAFFGISSHVSVGAALSGGGLGWVALSWGEPCVPWWGHRSFVGQPWWGGWHGPRVVNNVVVRQTTVINVTNIKYVNSRVPSAIIATPYERFGRAHVRNDWDRLRVQEKELVHIRGPLPVNPHPINLVADAPRAVHPPEKIISRSVVSTRRPQETKLPWKSDSVTPKAPEQRYVPAPKADSTKLRRPEPGTETGPERMRPPLPPRYEDWRRQAKPVQPSAVAREQRAVDGTESKVIRIVPSEAVKPIQRRESAPSSSVKPPISSNRPQPAPRIEEAPQQSVHVAPPETTTPVPRGRELSSPTPTSVRTTPQSPRTEITPKEVRPQEARGNLPGIPANRTYREAKQGKETPVYPPH